VAAALVMPLTMPVPPEYAKKFDAKNPSTYNQNVVFTGPYMVKNERVGQADGLEAREVDRAGPHPNMGQVDRTTGRPTWTRSTSTRATRTRRSRAAASSTARPWSRGDGAPPAPVKQAATRFKNQLQLVPAGGTRYVAMNTKIKPFDNVNVAAVFAIFDRNAMRLTRGGAIVGDLAWRYIPPGIPGFDEAGGLNPRAASTSPRTRPVIPPWRRSTCCSPRRTACL